MTGPARKIPFAAAVLIVWAIGGVPAPAAQTQGAAPQAKPGSGALIIAPPDSEIIKFDKPIRLGSDPIDGHSIKELIHGHPLYPPIEGLDRSIWDKSCDNCHQWTKERLCAQAKTYEGAGNKMMTRLKHPLGIPFKYILMRWATTGCQ